MHKNTETGVWEHDFRQKGIPRYHMSFGTTKKAEAEPLFATAKALFQSKETAVIGALRAGRLSLQQVREHHLKGRPFGEILDVVVQPDAWLPLSEAVTQYTDWLKGNRNKKKSTGRTAELQLREFVSYIGADVRVDQITSDMVTRYQTHLAESRGLKQNTVVAKVWRVSALFHWLIKRETRLAQDQKRPQRPLYVPIDHETIGTDKTSRRRFLNYEEAERLLAACPAQFLCPVAIGLYAGLRVEEVLHLRPAFDIDLSENLIAIQPQPDWQPKTKHSVRHVGISAPLRPILEHHLRYFASESWLVPAIKNPDRALNSHTFGDHFRRIVDDAELVRGLKTEDGVTFHTLRHTFASWLLMNGSDPYTVAKLLGNTIAQVEKTYGHLSKDFKRQAVNLLDGKVKLPDLLTPVRTAHEESDTTSATTEVLICT